MVELCGLRNLISDIKNTEDHMKRELKLTINQAAVLCSINEGSSKNVQISKDMGLSISRVSRLIASVELKGFVYRKVEEKDKRSVCFYLTEKGILTLYKLRNCESCLPKYIEQAIKNSKE